MARIQLQGKIFLTGTIKAVTGLHIGGNSGNLDIGGIDNPVIRNPFNRQPYIPGSSLRGKIRGLLDRHRNLPLRRMGGVQVHGCQSPQDYAQCDVCQVFGVAPSGGLRGGTMPTRLIVRDVSLTKKALEILTDAETEGELTEAKWEVAIDRITSETNLRHSERVPAGATFGDFELVYGIYTRNAVTSSKIQAELERFDIVLDGMELLQDDYLGGSGTRGYGKIEFEGLKMTFKPRTYYGTRTGKVKIADDNDIVTFKDIATLRQVNYTEKILSAIPTE